MTGITLHEEPARFCEDNRRGMVVWDDNVWRDIVEIWSHDPYVQNYFRNLHYAVCLVRDRPIISNRFKILTP